MGVGSLQQQPLPRVSDHISSVPSLTPRLLSASHRAGSATGLWYCPPTAGVQAPADPQLPALWGHVAILEGNEEGPSIPTPQPLLSREGSIRPCSGRVQVLLEQVRLWARSRLVKRALRPHHHPSALSRVPCPEPQDRREPHLSRHRHGNGLTFPLMQLVESVGTER